MDLIMLGLLIGIVALFMVSYYYNSKVGIGVALYAASAVIASLIVNSIPFLWFFAGIVMSLSIAYLLLGHLASREGVGRTEIAYGLFTLFSYYPLWMIGIIVVLLVLMLVLAYLMEPVIEMIATFALSIGILLVLLRIVDKRLLRELYA